MLNDKDFNVAAAAEPLYRWWLDVIPTALAGLTPDTVADAAAATQEASSQPFPIGQASQALELTQQMLVQLYDAFLQTLLANPPGQAFSAFQEQMQERFDSMTVMLASIGQAFPYPPDFAAMGSGRIGPPLAAFGQVLKPLSLNLERTYGGLADAFGLAASRELYEAARDMAAAALPHRQAQAEYLMLVVGALGKGAEAMTARLADMSQRGESIDSLLGLVRLWARTADEAMHNAMQSPRALQASAKLIRAATHSRKQQQRMVGIASEALNVPTRTELDDAYREIQELKRELRRLRKSIAPAAIEPQAADAAAVVRRASAPAKARARSANRKNSQKVTTA